MARQSFKIEGLKELQDALRELPKATEKNVLKRVLVKAAEPIRADAEANAPKGETLTLSTSHTVGTKLSRRQKSKHKKESAVEVFVGPAPSPKSITQEFGAAHHGAQPFMRPAWDANKRSAFDSIKTDLAEETEKARKRLARRAARLAAKMK